MDAILGDGVERHPLAGLRRAVDNAGVNAGLDRFENVTTGQIDCRGSTEGKLDDLRLAGGDHGADHQRHVAAGHVVGFQGPGGEFLVVVEARLDRHDFGARDDGGVHLAEPHPD